MNTARWSLIVLLAAIGAGALTLSASSTLQLATTAGVEHVQVAAIAVLELASIVGTIMWLRATTTRGRIEAAVLVIGASIVTAIGGLGAYGLFGLVGPIFLVASVHVASQEWRKPVEPVDQVVDSEAPERDDQDDHVPWGGPPEVEVAPIPVRRTANPAPRLRAVHDDGLEGLSRDQLREVARAEGVPVRGSRAEVAERVRAARAAVTTPVTDNETGEEAS